MVRRRQRARHARAKRFTAKEWKPRPSRKSRRPPTCRSATFTTTSSPRRTRRRCNRLLSNLRSRTRILCVRNTAPTPRRLSKSTEARFSPPTSTGKSCTAEAFNFGELPGPKRSAKPLVRQEGRLSIRSTRSYRVISLSVHQRRPVTAHMESYRRRLRAVLSDALYLVSRE